MKQGHVISLDGGHVISLRGGHENAPHQTHQNPLATNPDKQVDSDQTKGPAVNEGELRRKNLDHKGDLEPTEELDGVEGLPVIRVYGSRWHM